MSHRQLFWLHIKKSGGITTRRLLQPHYLMVDRARKPKNFIQAAPNEYNDILNNYRVVLGDYQFKRCLFAKEYLYPGRWDKMYSFAFSREPVDRCISMFFYLFWKHLDTVLHSSEATVRSWNVKKIGSDPAYAFDVFLDLAAEARESGSIYRPIDSHFTTHTAPVWDDVTDNDGKILLTRVFRLENLLEGINEAFEACGIEQSLDSNELRLNENADRPPFTPSASQMRAIENLYAGDFEIYERAAGI